MPTIKYFWLTLKHKWFVFIAGLTIVKGVSLWRLLTHDISKLGWSELPHYGRQFFGEADDPEGFINCWVHHQNRNDHHWEYWIPRTGHNRCDPPYPDGAPISMPWPAVAEMMADWLGAGRAYEGTWPDVENWTWYDKAHPRMNLHQDTLLKVDCLLIHLQNMQAVRRNMGKL